LSQEQSFINTQKITIFHIHIDTEDGVVLWMFPNLMDEGDPKWRKCAVRIRPFSDGLPSGTSKDPSGLETGCQGLRYSLNHLRTPVDE